MIQNIIIGTILAAIVSYLSFKVRFLTKGGSIAAFFLAISIFGLGGLKWSIPILTFFILSSLFSKINREQKRQLELFFQKAGARDSLQVFANGGLGGVLVILNFIYPGELFYYIYLASLAAVCADTWATEIGTIWKTRTYNAITFKPVEQGVSGGISFIGLLGALSGSSIIALSGFFWIEILPIVYFSTITAAGLIGSYMDSIIGASIQVQYKCSDCLKIVEIKNHCGRPANHFKGFKWITNDVVNFMASFTGGLSFIIIFKVAV